jgi:hypothetical protein
MRRVSLFFTCIVALSAACSSSESRTDSSATTPDVPGAPEAPGARGTGGGSGSGETRPDEALGGPYPPLFVGRVDVSDPAGPKLTWPGSRIVARFEGTRVSVKMNEYADHTWMGGAPSYWEVSIDKGEWKPIAMIADNQPHDFELASGLPNGEHTVDLYKRSEMQTGITQFLGFDFHGGKSLPPPPRQQRKIEVMGDSQSSGFGILMTDAPNTDCPGADHSGLYQNFRIAWGGLLGTMFDAEVHGIVYSGKGLMRNVWADDNDTLIDYYPRANPNPALQNSNPPLFDMKSWVPDVIVMAQGAMDWNSTKPVTWEEFQPAYRSFVIDTLRARSADTHIIMAVLGKGGRGATDEIARQIKAERAAAGDHKMHVFVANLYEWTEMLGCNGHGTPAWHQRIANELSVVIRDATGWQ